MKSEAIRPSETSAAAYKTTRCHNTEEHSRRVHRRENPKSLMIPNLTSIFRCSMCSKQPVKILGSVSRFVIRSGVVRPPSHPLSAVRTGILTPLRPKLVPKGKHHASREISGSDSNEYEVAVFCDVAPCRLVDRYWPTFQRGLLPPSSVQ
jgi:hypothetical protein